MKLFETYNHKTRHLYIVRRTLASLPWEKPSGDALKELDLVLKVQQKWVTSIADLDVSTQWPEKVMLTIIRDKQQREILVKPMTFDGVGTSRVLVWAGAVIQGQAKLYFLGEQSTQCSLFL